jgi:hypothetical protein
VAKAAAPDADEDGGVPELDAAVGASVMLAAPLEAADELILALALAVALADAKREDRALDSDADEAIESAEGDSAADEAALDSTALEAELCGFSAGEMAILAFSHWSPMCWSYML